MEHKKEMTLPEMQEECIRLAFEISNLESNKNNYIKRFDALNYKIRQYKIDINNAPEAAREDNQ